MTYPIDSDFIVRVSAAKMPSSCWGKYVHVAVVEVPEGVTAVPAIDERHPNVRSIVEFWGKCHVGKTPKAAASMAIDNAKRMAGELNRRQAARRELAAKDHADALALAT